MLGKLIPDPEVLLALEPEELAGALLEHLNSLDHQSREQLNRFNIVQAGSFPEYAVEYRDRIAAAVMEAWVWLEREGLIAPKPGTSDEWRFITRRGERLATATDVAAYRRANLLPKSLLHPVIAQKVWAAFLRGDYDVAVFQAFKEVEVAVREACDFSDTDIGVDLMRKAFDKSGGPLTHKYAPKGEREALAHLFAGAIGTFKNPQSHRAVNIKDAPEAVEMIMLASHLLRIVDSRSSTPSGVSGDP